MFTFLSFDAELASEMGNAFGNFFLIFFAISSLGNVGEIRWFRKMRSNLPSWFTFISLLKVRSSLCFIASGARFNAFFPVQRFKYFYYFQFACLFSAIFLNNSTNKAISARFFSASETIMIFGFYSRSNNVYLTCHLTVHRKLIRPRFRATNLATLSRTGGF